MNNYYDTNKFYILYRKKRQTNKIAHSLTRTTSN